MLVPISDLTFHRQLARLLAHLDAPAFWQQLTQCLSEVAHFDNWVAMLCRPAQPPLILADFNANLQDEDLFSEYRHDVYLLDPFFQLISSGPEGGLYRLDDVAPDNFRQTEYFRRYFAINIVEDEVQYLAPVPGLGIVSLSLGKAARFDAQDIGGLALYKDWVIELMRLRCRRNPVATGDHSPNMAEANARFEIALAKHCVAPLTKRELEIALLILRGHSNKGIAALLGISGDTVKVHRRNIYAKLEITTQAALFMLLIDADSSAEARPGLV